MESKNTNLLSCWPDGYSRYYSIANILRIVFNDTPLKILDVGGDSKWMSEFLSSQNLDYSLNIVDTREPDFNSKRANVTYTQGDFFKLEKENFLADAVINTDVLEHIPKELKIPFVNQCIDFSKSIIIFSAPQDDNDVTFAEENINNFYQKYAGKQQYWLKEHFEFGKPNPKNIAEAITAKGYPFLCIDTNNLENWFTSFSLNFTNSEVCELVGMDELNKFYNKNIHNVGDFAGKPYRKIFIVFKDSTLFEKTKDDITSFFTGDDSKRNEFLTKSIALLLETFTSKLQSSEKEILALKDSHVSLNNHLTLMEKNLKQTQGAFVIASKELEEVKQSRAFRYSKTVKKFLP